MARWLLLGFALVGCRGLEPALGGWTVQGFTVDSDTCALFDDYTAGQVFRFSTPIGAEADLSWQLTDALAADCLLDGGALTCEAIAVTGGDADATVTTETALAGIFDDAVTLAGQFTVTATCEGASCAPAGFTAPCEAAISIDATANNPPAE